MPPEERNLKKTAFAQIFNTYPEKVEACRNLLQILSKRSSHISLQNDPTLQFVNLQMHLTTSELHNKIENQTLSHSDIFDNCENLCQLFTLLTSDRAYVCVKFSASIQQLCTAVTEVCNMLEKKSNAKLVNWPAVGKNFVKEAKEADAKQTRTSFLDYIPKLAEFEQVCRLGTGAFSEVYLVTHKTTGHPFAMKISPRSKFVQQGTVNEAEAASAAGSGKLVKIPSITIVDKMVAAIAHDFLVCRTFCVFQAEPDVDITLMEVSETDVDVLRIVDLLGYIGSDDSVLIAFQVTLALEHLHLRGFIHRDVRPSNFVIDRYGRLKLVDFDSAKVCRGHFPFKRILTDFFKRTANEFKDKECVGAIAYTAPEVLKRKTYGRASDWWSLGVSMYKITTGRLPFRGADAAAVTESIWNDDLRWPKAAESPHSATPEIKEYVYDLLKKNPLSRLGTKIYSDLQEPAAIVTAINLLRPVHTLKDGGLIKETRTKLYIIGFSEIDRNIGKELKAPVNTLVSNRPTSGTFLLSELKDKSDDSPHFPLMTFAHTKFRRFTDRQGGTFPGSERYLVQITPPEREIDYLARDDAETLIGVTMQETAAQRQAQVALLDVFFLFRTKWFFLKKLNVELRLVQGEGKLTYPVVYSKKHSANEEDLGEVIHDILSNSSSWFIHLPIVFAGDILVTVEKHRLTGLSMDRVGAVLRQCMKKSEGRLRCQVFANNIFRYAQTHFNSVINMVNQSPLSEATLSSKRGKFFETRLLKLWSTEAKDFVSIHVVILVHLGVSLTDGTTMVFYGDVLMQINGHDVSLVDAVEVERLWQDRTTVNVIFHEMSVLRRKDLHEAGIDNESCEADLENMSARRPSGAAKARYSGS